MSNWYQQKTLFLVLLGFFLGIQSAGIAAFKNRSQLNLNFSPEFNKTTARDLERSPAGNSDWATLSYNFASSPKSVVAKPKIDSWLVRQTNNCQNIDPAYQKVYSFETENYYIDICQMGDRFYYRRQAKFDDENTIIIPAVAIFRGGVFQAISKGITYFVGKDGDRYYSSVMQNDSEIVFEPELKLAPDSALARGIAGANSQLPSKGMEASRATNASVEDRPENTSNSSQVLICTGENAANSRLDYWQKLIGESSDMANQYAVSNGHSFVYDAQTPEQAFITTQEGEVIDLNIATVNDTIERVCIRPIAGN